MTRKDFMSNEFQTFIECSGGVVADSIKTAA